MNQRFCLHRNVTSLAFKMILMLILFVSLGQVYSVCPPCVKYQNPLPRHLLGFELTSEKCICEQELTRCAVINPVCPPGTQCVLRTIPVCTFPPCQLESAVCEPFTACQELSCPNKCDKSGYLKDPNNCQTCVCNDPCSETTCGANEKCVTVIEIGGGQTARCEKKEACPPCVTWTNPYPTHLLGTEINSDGCACTHDLTKCSVVKPPCPAGQQCVLKPITKCTFPPCQLESAFCESFTSCPLLKCQDSCSNSGFLKDQNGCQTCTCNEPCKEMTCPTDKKCVVVVEIGGSQYGRCDLKEACPACVASVNPLPVHVLGIEINSDGCKCNHNLTKCSTVNPVCPKGQQCVMKPLSKCTFPPCKLDSAVCEPFKGCPAASCSNSCSKSGYLKDQNGCQTCVCNEPCQETTCPSDKKCVTVVETGDGKYARCDPKEACPSCVASINTLPVHVQGIEINSDGCKCTHNLTRCAVVNPVCPKGKECVLKPLATCTFPPCKMYTAFCEPFKGCRQVTCSISCPNSGYIFDPNGCQTCVCKSPCKETTCAGGQKCVTMVEVGGGQYAKCMAQ